MGFWNFLSFKKTPNTTSEMTDDAKLRYAEMKCMNLMNFTDDDIVKAVESAAEYKYNDCYYIKDKYNLLLLLINMCFSKFDVTIKNRKVTVRLLDYMILVSKYNKLVTILEAMTKCCIEISNGSSMHCFDVVFIDSDGDFFSSMEKNFTLAKLHKDYIPVLSSLSGENDFDVDVVYTYVDSTDENWKNDWSGIFGIDQYDPNRYESHDELKYSLRSINQYMPWVHRIYIVSNCNPPAWLNTSHEKIVWVDHHEIIDEKYLPTFNSHVIESFLHRIKGLADNFVYFNDDVFVNTIKHKTDFFVYKNMSINFREPYDIAFWTDAIIGDEIGYKNAVCNVQELLFKNFGYRPRYLMQHAPHPVVKSVCCEMEDLFKENFANTREHKIRSKEDLNILSFLYPHYAFIHGKSKHDLKISRIVTPKNYKQFIKQNADFDFFCLNAWDSENADFVKSINDFLKTKYKVPAKWEI